MIVAKQLIKTNQVLSVWWSLSIGKIESVCQMCHTKWESTESTSSERFLYFPCQKKLKKSWEQSWVETKLLELKHLLDQTNSPNDKPP